MTKDQEALMLEIEKIIGDNFEVNWRVSDIDENYSMWLYGSALDKKTKYNNFIAIIAPDLTITTSDSSFYSKEVSRDLFLYNLKIKFKLVYFK